jgi:branched-chain amino acid transport system substrate-binding protein
MLKLGLALVGPVLALALLVSQGTAGTTAKPKGAPIVIGTSLPLTGRFSEPGTAAARGYATWVKMTNNRGGLLGRPVKIVIKDDGSDQNTVVSDYNRLITQDKVDLLLGTFSSLLNLPAATVAERNKKVYVCPACGSPRLFDRKYAYYFFSQPATAPHQADLFSAWLKGMPRAKRPKSIALPTQDDPFTKPVIDGIKDRLEGSGITVVYSTVYPPDTTNFDTIASAIKASGAEAVATGTVFEDGVGLVRAFKRIGYNPKVLFSTTAPSLGKEYSKAVGVKNTEGIFYAVSWSSAAKYPLNQAFVKAYTSKWKVPVQEVPEDAADAFASAQVLEKAVRAVGGLDQDKLKDYLHSHRVMTILGPLRWDQYGAPQGAFLLAQWQNGRPQIVLPKKVATSKKIVMTKPRWR